MKELVGKLGMHKFEILVHPRAKGFDLEPKLYFAITGSDGIEALFSKIRTQEEIVFEASGCLLARGCRPSSLVPSTIRVETINDVMSAFGRGNCNDAKALDRNRPNTDATWRQSIMKFLSTRAGAKELSEKEAVEHLQQDEAIVLGQDHHAHLADGLRRSWFRWLFSEACGSKVDDLPLTHRIQHLGELLVELSQCVSEAISDSRYQCKKCGCEISLRRTVLSAGLQGEVVACPVRATHMQNTCRTHATHTQNTCRVHAPVSFQCLTF